MAKKKRLGNQKPTQSVVLPYRKSRSGEAAKLYAKTKRSIQEWQKLLLGHILAINDDGLWVHTKFGYSVSRRNGKNEVVAAREMWGGQAGEKILQTAHRTTAVLPWNALKVSRQR